MCSNLSLLHMTNLPHMLAYCCDLHCFDAKSSLLWFTHFCVEQNLIQTSCPWSKNEKFHICSLPFYISCFCSYFHNYNNFTITIFRVNPCPYLIFVIFSPPIQFSAQFFSTQKRVNHNKTDYAKNSVNCHKTDFTTKSRVNFRFLHLLTVCHVENFEIPPNLGTFLISPHLLCEKSEIPLHMDKFQIFPHLACIEIWNFSTWPIFSPPIGDRGDKYEVCPCPYIFGTPNFDPIPT